MPFSHTSQPRPQAPSVGDSQLSSTKRMSCTRGSKPSETERAQVKLLEIVRRGFDGDLELVVVLEAEGIVAVPAIGGPPRGLDIGRAPRLRADRAQERRRMEGARPHFHVVGLQYDASSLRPVALEREDQVLERARRRLKRFGHPREYSDAPLGLSRVAKAKNECALIWIIGRPGQTLLFRSQQPQFLLFRTIMMHDGIALPSYGAQ